MRWGNMRGSGNVEDRESAGPAGGISGGLKLGGVGLIAVLAISWFLGLNPLDVLGLAPGRGLALGADAERAASGDLGAGSPR